MALVLVLTALTLMTILLTSVQDDTSAELGDAVTSRDALKAEYAARSAINLARLLISAEPTIRASAGVMLSMLTGQMPAQIPVWEQTATLMGAFNDAASTASFAAMAGIDLEQSKGLGLDGARFEVTVVDEDSKINVNIPASSLPADRLEFSKKFEGLTRGVQYDALFDRPDMDGQDSNRGAICSALVDWVDSDMDEYVCDPYGELKAYNKGAEDAFYQLLKTPYPRKNAAFDSVEELRMVRGIGDDFWATFVQPDPWDPASRTLTIWGKGKVNVNTANAETIMAAIVSEVCVNEEAVRSEPICGIDPTPRLTLMTAIQFVKMLTKGAPIFSKPEEFIKTISGQDARGKMFQQMLGGLDLGGGSAGGDSLFQLPKFPSPAAAARSLTTTSQVFTVQATGIVQSGTRETRRQVTAVIDFRGAPPPMPGLPPNELAEARGGMGADSGELNLNMPTPGGKIVYYRVD